MKFVLLMAALALGACSYQVRQDEYRLTIVDNKQAEAFDLSFVSNRSSGDICIDTASWPNHVGFMDGAKARVRVAIDGSEFTMKPFNEGYCPGGCKISVAPGQVLSASVPYANFDIPRELYGREKHLHFPLALWKCEYQ